MPLNTPRILLLKAHLLEMIVSAAAIGLGVFMWVSMNGANSGINLLAGAAFLVAGFIVFGFAMRSILRY
jgi:Na+-transporting NADH:ubiquinone oxidoreductase subunit NqrD